MTRLWFVEWAAGAADGGTGMLHAFDELFCVQAAQGALREIARRAPAAASGMYPHDSLTPANG